MIKNIKLWKLIDYMVWSLPLAAMLLSFYLIFDYYASRDINLRIVFKDASSIEPQKTQLVYKGIVVGVVEGVQLDAKSHGVVVRASLDREANDLAADGTRFKIVQPKVGFSGISGLETLLKGSYIKIEKGNTDQGLKQKIKTEFAGITTDEEDEMHDATAYVLRASNGKGLNVGMPIEFKGVKIGSVVSIDFEGLTKQGVFNYQDILVKIGIDNKYTDIINAESRFWKRPAVNARLDVSGMNFEISSLEALLKGGILVESSNSNAEAAPAGHQFALHEKMPAKRSSEAEVKVFQLITNDAESLQKNDPVFYRGIKTGAIQDVHLKDDGRAVVRVRVNAQHKHLVKANSVFWRKSAVDSKLGWSGLSLRVSSLESLVRGGINFATPSKLGAEVQDGFSFALNDREPEEDWKNWKPQFPQKVHTTDLSLRYE